LKQYQAFVWGLYFERVIQDDNKALKYYTKSI
jgi:hypothetical protein